jgi:hypothetical protein
VTDFGRRFRSTPRPFQLRSAAPRRPRTRVHRVPQRQLRSFLRGHDYFFVTASLPLVSHVKTTDFPANPFSVIIVVGITRWRFAHGTPVPGKITLYPTYTDRRRMYDTRPCAKLSGDNGVLRRYYCYCWATETRQQYVSTRQNVRVPETTSVHELSVMRWLLRFSCFSTVPNVRIYFIGTWSADRSLRVHTTLAGCFWNCRGN